MWPGLPGGAKSGTILSGLGRLDRVWGVTLVVWLAVYIEATRPGTFLSLTDTGGQREGGGRECLLSRGRAGCGAGQGMQIVAILYLGLGVNI